MIDFGIGFLIGVVCAFPIAFLVVVFLLQRAK